MTETKYLTSDNPAELVAFLGERITDGHQRLYFEACRKERDAEYSRTKNSDWEVPAALRADILRDIVPYRKLGYVEDGVLWLDRGYTKDHNHSHVWEPVNWLQWNDGAIPSMVDAMMNEDCNKPCQSVAGRTGRWVWIDGVDTPHWLGCVCKNGRIPRTEPRWSDMLEIADALEEAGCRDQRILEHLRSDGERCPWCYNGRVRIGYLQKDCSHCKGTGRIKRRHWRGCHVIELLSQKS